MVINFSKMFHLMFLSPWPLETVYKKKQSEILLTRKEVGVKGTAWKHLRKKHKIEMKTWKALYKEYLTGEVKSKQKKQWVHILNPTVIRLLTDLYSKIFTFLPWAYFHSNWFYPLESEQPLEALELLSNIILKEASVLTALYASYP